MRKHKMLATTKDRARAAVFNDDPAHDDPHDAIDQELLGIWLSISRLRQMIRGRPPAAARRPRHPVAAAAAPKKPTHKKPRRKAA